MEKQKGTKCAGGLKGMMKGRARGDKRHLVGLIIERVGGRREPCWSDRSAEPKPSSGLPSFPADVKASAQEG